MRCAIMLISFVVLPAIGFSQTTWYTPDDFPTIQAAISDASVVNGDTIIVRPGTYVENIDFLGKAVTVKSEQGPDITTIDGNQAGRVVTCKSGEKTDSVLDGFTITNGYADNGGGMRNDSSSPTVTNCVFIENSATNQGGGMANYNSSNPLVTNCAFTGNSSTKDGGGICNAYSSCPIIKNCAFTKNSTGTFGNGGGMYNMDKSSPKVNNCAFIGNSANQAGGMHNTFYSSPEVINCLFIGNSTTTVGGGMRNYKHSNPSLINCTFTKNKSKLYGGGMDNYSSDPIVTNCIFWKDTAPEFDNDGGSSPIVTYSCVMGGYPGAGNINADPQFVDYANSDTHLTHTSPCKDAGDNTVVVESNDNEGDPRIVHGTVDMGADEFHTHLYFTGNASPGGNISLKFIDTPSTGPVVLWLGSGVLSTPMNLPPYGTWHLQFPILFQVGLGSIPSPDGVLVLNGVIPATMPAPVSLPFQAGIGTKLTNLLELHIQ